MAKSKDKRTPKPESREKSEKPLVKVDKKTFDPTLASLFASSVRVAAHPHSIWHKIADEFLGRPSASTRKVTLPGSRT
jgi:hypothetical protein